MPSFVEQGFYKHKKLTLSRSCPGFTKDSLKRSLLERSPLRESKDRVVRMSSCPPSNFIKRKHRQAPITQQPTRFTTSKNVRLNAYRAKHCVSCLTCYWCLDALCYHCVTKDDVGPRSPCTIAKEASKLDVVRAGVIGVTCLPFLPCLSLYPILNTLLGCCLDDEMDE